MRKKEHPHCATRGDWPSVTRSDLPNWRENNKNINHVSTKLLYGKTQSMRTMINALSRTWTRSEDRA